MSANEMLDRIEATLDASERIMNASPFWDENSRYTGKALLDYTRSQIIAERKALASDEVLGEAGYTVSGQVYEAAVAGRQDFRQAYREALVQLKSLENAFVPTEEEQAAIVAMGADLSLSHAAVVRQALRHYQLSHTRVKAGETVQWSGDAQRARDFAGPLSASPVPVDASGTGAFVPSWLIGFLNGEHSWPGYPEVWFGDRHPDHRGAFFWRASLPKAHTAPVADAQAGEGGL